MEDMEVYKRFAVLSDEIWNLVIEWDYFAKKTIGAQLVTAADSIGANLMEGDGRYGLADSVRFFIYARGSAKETLHWLERCSSRKLMEAGKINGLKKRLVGGMQMLNKLISYRRQTGQLLVRESAPHAYIAEAEPILVTDRSRLLQTDR
jgi:four helix bundle protein